MKSMTMLAVFLSAAGCVTSTEADDTAHPGGGKADGDDSPLRVIAKQDGTVFSVAADSKNVYWLVGDTGDAQHPNGGLYSCPVAGCGDEAPKAVWTDMHPTSNLLIEDG